MCFGLRVAQAYTSSPSPCALSFRGVPRPVPAAPCLGSPAPLSVPEFERVWLLAARAGEPGRGSVLYSNRVAVVGEGSACDSVVCVCLASASLNKQWLGWAMPGVCNAAGAGVRVRAKGKGTLTLHPHPHHRPGRGSRGWKAPRRRRCVLAGAGGPGGPLRDSCFSVGQLPPVTSPPEKGCPAVPGPAPPSPFGGELVEARPETCRCPGPVSRPPAAAGGEGRSSRAPCALDAGTPPSLPGTSTPGLQLAPRLPGCGEKPGGGR